MALAFIASGALVLVATPPAAAAPGDCWGAAIATLDDGTTVKVCAVNPVTGPGANYFHDVLGNTIGFFRDSDWRGPLWMYPNYSDGRCITFTSANNTITSWRSRLTNPGNIVYVFNPSGCPGGLGGSDQTLRPDSYEETIEKSGPDSNDQWSSLDYG
jgi:hypothetical protein